MRILLDDHVCPFEAATIGAAVAHGAQLAEQSGRRVVDVAVDGAAWTDADLASPNKLAAPAGEVRMTTVCPADLLAETFLNAAQALLDAEELQRNAAKLLQADQPKAGMDALMEALQVWMNIQRAVVGGLEFGRMDPASVQSSEGSFNAAVDDLNTRFTGLRDAMRSNDTVAVCDCLLYEFPATTKRWAAILAELARRADADRPTAAR